MKVLGLIVEYNPFHHGHLYHLQQSVKKSQADVVIAVMSGSFLQRGEPALVDKWSRTRMALQGGVDLVVELPYIYSTQKAEIFAEGAIALLDSLSVTDICFGSEEGQIEPFIETVHWLNKNQKLININLKKELAKGKSYPRAFSDVYRSLRATNDVLDLTQPNNILGFHYVQSVMERNSSIHVHTIKRTGAHFHDQEMTGKKIASATAIRKHLNTKEGQKSDIQSYVPEFTHAELSHYYSTKGSFHSWEDYFFYLQHKIISESSEEMKQLYECEEGLEYRIKREIIQASSFEEFIQKLKTKRYTRTRLQRLLVHLYLNTTKSFMNNALKEITPPYIRVLGMSQKGQKHLSTIKDDRSVPIITRASESDHPVLEKDIVASRLHSIIHHASGSSFMDEYRAIPIQYDKNTKEFL
ncbi:nucleotidyltransferase [Salipaludibacillus sp. HK11]|uniref:nucleotidyltransferase n=1 Tax=Salipaludibacillus sp. HK11 TaxID=3394320 RepID=UPI0039FD81CC